MVHQLVYISRANVSLTVSELNAILIAENINDLLAEVTELLLFDGRRFNQALEGPEAGVVMVMDRIMVDHRHHDIAYMPLNQVPERQFAPGQCTGKVLSNVTHRASERLG